MRFCEANDVRIGIVNIFGEYQVTSGFVICFIAILWQVNFHRSPSFSPCIIVNKHVVACAITIKCFICFVNPVTWYFRLKFGECLTRNWPIVMPLDLLKKLSTDSYKKKKKITWKIYHCNDADNHLLRVNFLLKKCALSKYFAPNLLSYISLLKNQNCSVLYNVYSICGMFKIPFTPQNVSNHFRKHFEGNK